MTPHPHAETRPTIQRPSSNDNRLPEHVDAAVRSVAELHAEHQHDATKLQRTAHRITAKFAQPAYIIALTALIATWITVNSIAEVLGYRAPDPAPFVWLEFVVALCSLYMVLLIYATQRRDDALAELREQLALQLALLNESRTAKVIQLLEELRCDMPIVDNRHDPEAAALAEPAEAGTVVEAIRKTQEAATRENLGSK